MLPKERAVKFGHLLGGGFPSFAGAKVRLFLKLAKHSPTFFSKQRTFNNYTLYILYAREEIQE